MKVVVGEVSVMKTAMFPRNHNILAQPMHLYQNLLIFEKKRLTVDTRWIVVLPKQKVFISSTASKRQKHTTGGIPRWSPTLVLVARFSAYVWQSGRDAQFSLTYGRMCLA